MFEVCVTVTPQINGLRALDERRRLGMPDGTSLGTDEHLHSFKFEVSEEFARQFPEEFADDDEMDIDVPTSSFEKGELIIDPADKANVEAGPSLTEARLLQLAKAYFAEDEQP